MKKKIPTVPVKTQYRDERRLPGTRAVKPTRNRRKESNEEVMMASIRRRGFTRCRIVFQLLHAEVIAYTSWNGQSLTVDSPSVEALKDFRAKLGDAIYRLCKETGCSMPDVVEVPKEG